jgi:hypothetical protein
VLPQKQHTLAKTRLVSCRYLDLVNPYNGTFPLLSECEPRLTRHQRTREQTKAIMSRCHVLCAAIDEGDITSMELLLNGDTNPTDRDLRDALFHAAWRDRAEAASILMAHGAQIEHSFIPIVIECKAMDVLQLFLDRGYDLNSSIAVFRHVDIAQTIYVRLC